MGSLAWLFASLPLLASAVLVAQTESQRRRFRAPDSLPYSKKKFFFSGAERSLYQILRCITPDHSVFANVRLCDLIAASEEDKNWRTNHNRKNLDFLICDATLTPVIAIELDSSRARASRKSRDQSVDAALTAAAIPLVRIPVKRSYALDEVRRLIFPHVHGLGPLC
jgi:hypothetical protein